VYQFNFAPVIHYLPKLLAGALLTLTISSVAIALGFALGVTCAVLRDNGPSPVRMLVSIYVEAVRNTPFLVQLFIVYFALPTVGIKLTAVEAGLVAMVANLGAYAAEIVRAGMEAVHRLQLEAGAALGMSRLQILRHVVLPPAIEAVYPSLTSQFILMMLASSLLSAISVGELTGVAQLLDSLTFRSFEIYAVVGVLYVLITLLMKAAFQGIGYASFKRWRRLRTGPAWSFAPLKPLRRLWTNGRDA